MMCELCHAVNGMPRSPTIPVIWGQGEAYLLKQLRDFQSKARDVEVMEWAAKSLSPEELAPVAAYFSKKTWPARSAAAAASTPPRGIAVCQACHQADFRGAPLAEGAAAPRLAGQSYEYLLGAMRGYAQGERTNNAQMLEIMKAISPADQEAMARYISSL
jgi:cytochrome c553